jgi:hypothetical protein
MQSTNLLGKVRPLPRLSNAHHPTPRFPQVVGTTAFGIDFHTLDDPDSPSAEEGLRLVRTPKPRSRTSKRHLGKAST